MPIDKIKDLAVKHNYYCSDSNYYSNQAQHEWRTWEDYYNEFHNVDLDLNLVFRWDIHKENGSDNYSMEIFIIQQRKGIFCPHYIYFIKEKDLAEITEYLNKCWIKLKTLWQPISNI